MRPPDDFDPPAGIAEQIAPSLRRLLCPNPSPMTYRGTNTYLLGTRDIAVIDPGPMDDQHLMSILGALEPGQHISHIIVTHSHLDHSPLARPLSDATDAPVIAFGDSNAGRSAIMLDLENTGLAGGGEGVDHTFMPDQVVADGDQISGSDWSLNVLHTPGHLGNHICLGWGSQCFTADHVMGWASSLVSPPEGDLTDFMASCFKLKDRNWSCFHPGHGAPITDPMARLDWLITHRLTREAQILDTLNSGAATAHEIAVQIYTDTPAKLLGAAQRNVFAHLVDLTVRGLVSPTETLSADVSFRLT